MAQQALDIARELLERTGWERKQKRKGLTLAQDVDAATILTRLPAAFAGAELVISSLGACAAGITFSSDAVEAAAVRWFITTGVFIPVIREQRMVI